MAYSVSTRFRQENFIDYFSVNPPLDQSMICTLPTAYRTAFSRNQLELLEGRLVYYEQISFANKYICRSIVHFSLSTNVLIVCILHQLLGIWMNSKLYIEFFSVSFGHECVPVLTNGSKNVHTVHSYTAGDVVVKNGCSLSLLVFLLLFFTWIYGYTVIIPIIMVIWLL